MLTARLLSISPATVPEGNIEALRRMLDRSFLAKADWDPAAEVFAPSLGHPLLGFRISATDASRFRQPVVSLGARCGAPLGRRSCLQLSVPRPGASARHR
jgi:hypothetical protein